MALSGGTIGDRRYVRLQRDLAAWTNSLPHNPGLLWRLTHPVASPAKRPRWER